MKEWTVAEDGYIHLPGTVVDPSRKGLEKWAGGRLYPVAVSEGYNGGITFTDAAGVEQWAKGFKVDKPQVPDGWTLASIHCGAQLNARPPMLPMLLRKG